ncbi:hypothetical protein Vretifemale_12913 [Volvox reticuliferus]|uniref:Uncharacterized protein n=1 Tax=Volvox reticuliferus TaxID=1737510 RepID=A0A8J4CSI1_9CHLO|nr:hypothetical protein Vretifemale_12913 [Volvox reticuliferus]
MKRCSQQICLRECATSAGGLYRGHYAEQAIRRYWLLWMPLLHEQQQHSRPVANFLVPPLDVQWAWFVHRLNPVQYLKDCTARFGTGVHPGDIQQALGFSNGSSSQPQKFPSRQQHHHAPSAEPNKNTTRQVWEAAYPAGPCYPAEHAFWPPAPPPPPSAGKRQKQCARPHLCQQPHNFRHLQQRQHGRQQQKREQQQQGQQEQQEQQQQHPEVQENRHPPQAAAGMLPDGDGGNRRDGTDGGLGGGGGDGKRSGGAYGSDRDTDGSGGGGGDDPVPPSPPLPERGTLESVWSYVADAMVRQGRFAHQTLRYFYQDPDFLEAGRIRYLHFLTLLRTQPPGAPLLNPMYDQDVMWHSHLALSGVYVADCEAIMPVGRRPLGHDDLLSDATLANSFVFTLGRYEEVTGLMVNPSPTRRLPTFVAQPLAAQLWPLAAALADPRVSKLPTPRELAAELRTGSMQQDQRGTRSDHRQKEKPGSRCINSSDGKGNDSSSSSNNNMGAAANPASRSGVFSGDKDPPPGGGNRPPMLGSPDHLCRNGTFAVYALWNLAERLRLLSVAHTQQEKQQRQGEEEEGRERRLQQPQSGEEQQVLEQKGKEAVKLHRKQQQQQQPDGGSTAALGQGSSCGRQPGLFASCFTGSGTFASLPSQRSLRAAAAARAGVGEEIGDGELDSALRHMTQQLLRLRDLSDPNSPLGSHQHPFWHHVTPLPPPPRMPQLPAPQPQHVRNQEQQDQRHPQQQQPPPPFLPSNAYTPTSSVPASSSSYLTTCNPPSATTTAGAASGGAGGSTGNTCRRRIRRHPAPAPRIDLPSSFLPASERSAESVYLARDQYAARGQVYYTPSDFCLLGDGRWCLPGLLAIEIAEREAAEADGMYDDDAEQAKINDHDDTARRGGYCHRYLGRQPRWRSRVCTFLDSHDGSDDSYDEDFFHYGNDHLRLYRNTLGHIVFSSRWPRHMARCYHRIYKELHRRRLSLAAT